MAFNPPQPSYYIPQQPDFHHLDPAAVYAQPPFQSPSYPPHPAAFNQLHAPESQAQQRFHHAAASHQQYQVPNQAHGHGPPAPMPPPDSPFHPQHYYPPPHQHHQPTPISSAPLAGPVSTFPTPSQNRTPPQAQGPPQSPQIFRSPPPPPPKAQQPPMTATLVKPAAPSNPMLSTPPKDSTKPSAPPTSSPSLESQRVTTLLELNRILLQEVVREQAVHNAQKVASNPTTQAQQAPQQQQQPTPASSVDSTTTPATSTTTTTTQPQSDTTKPDAESSSVAEDAKSTPTTQPPNQQQQQQTQPPNPGPKIPHTKEYVEYMRRLQANLAYLASVADRNHKPGNAVPQHPAIMEAPNPSAQPPSAKKDQSTAAAAAAGGDAKETIRELYAKLRELWPEYKGKGQMPGLVPTTATSTATAQGATMGTMGAGSQAPAVTTASAA